MYFSCVLIQVLKGASHGPSPAPGLFPPSQPTPSQVGDGYISGGVRAAELPLGGTGGGGVRAAELPLGATAAHSGEEERGLSPTPGFLPPSHPNPSKVGDGIYFNGDGGGGGGLRSSSFFESTITKGSTVCTVEKRHLASSLHTPPLTFPTNTLKLALVCFFFSYVVFHLLI